MTADATDRAEELERRFGDPFDRDNPLGHAAALQADERAEPHTDGERMLDGFGLNREFVPVSLGGRLVGLDGLAAVLRSVYRHDPCLGLGYGFSSFIAAVNVWTAGGDEHRRAVADLLLANRKVASAYHELAHGNDLGAVECAARPAGDRLVLNGRKEVVTNIARADALVLYARTDSSPGSRSHSQVFVDKAADSPDRLRDLPRFPSAGMRGVQLGGIEFLGFRTPATSVVGRAGHGVETALRSFQLTRTLLPAIMAGQLDTGLRVTVRHVLGRRLYGRSVGELPVIRSILAEVFVDLLTVECLTTSVARAIHLLPGDTSVAASAAKHFASGVLIEAMDRLAGVLGAHSYLRDGDTAIFQKMLRDLAPVGFGHAARAACQTTVLPQLPLLARRSWTDPTPAPHAVFRPGTPLPPLPFDRLAVIVDRDHLVGALAEAHEDAPTWLRDLVEVFTEELRDLARECAALSPRELTVAAGPRAARLATRYGLVLAATACVQVWLRDRPNEDPAWLVAALHRLTGRLRGGAACLPHPVERTVFADLIDRHEAAHGFDLARTRLAG